MKYAFINKLIHPSTNSIFCDREFLGYCTVGFSSISELSNYRFISLVNLFHYPFTLWNSFMKSANA